MVAIDAEVASAHRRLSESWNDDRDVAGDRDHWVRLIRCALKGTERMRMDVGDDFEPETTAPFPEGAEVTAIESNYASGERIGVEIVVQDEVLDRRKVRFAFAKEECTALTYVLASIS